MRATLAAAILALAAPAAALAATVELKFADLDLNSAAGQAELAGRIEAAARAACTAEPATGTRLSRPVDGDCVRETKAELKRKFVRRASETPTLAGRQPAN
ncbi:MAG: UrcA family protein [Novosphingobium sp.]